MHPKTKHKRQSNKKNWWQKLGLKTWIGLGLFVALILGSISFQGLFKDSKVENKEAQASGVLSIDLNQTYQTIEGMGGFGPSQPWWTSDNPSVFWDEAWVAKLKDMGVSLVREQINPYFENTNDNNDPNNLNLNGFYADKETRLKRVPYLKRLQQENIKIIVSVWSAPPWLKVNNSINEICPGNDRYCSNANYQGPNRSTNRLKDDPTSLAEFAERMVGYIRLMENEGIQIYGLSISNEPLFNQWFESSSFDPELYAKAFNAVATRFAQENITTKLFGIENLISPYFRDQTQAFLDKLQADYPQSMNKLHAIAVHGYSSDGITGDPGTASDFAAHKTLGQKYGGKKIWMTEQSNSGNGEWGPTAFPTAKGMVGALRDGDLSLSTWWYWDNGVFDQNLNPKKLAHVLKQFYRYLKPGDVRVQANSPYTDVSLVAFRDSGSSKLKLVFVNDSTATRNISFANLASNLPKNYTGFYTTENVNFSPITANNSVVLPAKSVVSLEANLNSGSVSSSSSSVVSSSTSSSVSSVSSSSVSSSVSSSIISSSSSSTSSGKKTYQFNKINNGAISVDGNRDTLWLNVQSQNITNNSLNLPNIGLSGNFRGVHDDANLYFLYDVTDPQVVSNRDSIEVYLNPTATGSTYTDNNCQIRVFAVTGRLESGLNNKCSLANIIASSQLRNGGYYVEIKIPKSNFGLNQTITSATKIGLEAQIDSNPQTGDRNGNLQWNDSTNNAWQNPNVWGIGTFVTTATSSSSSVSQSVSSTSSTSISSTVSSNSSVVTSAPVTPTLPTQSVYMKGRNYNWNNTTGNLDESNSLNTYTAINCGQNPVNNLSFRDYQNLCTQALQTANGKNVFIYFYRYQLNCGQLRATASNRPGTDNTIKGFANYAQNQCIQRNLNDNQRVVLSYLYFTYPASLANTFVPWYVPKAADNIQPLGWIVWGE